jgi:hypothetical protein
MRLNLLVILGALLGFNSLGLAKNDAKSTARKIAQQASVKCVPLGSKFSIDNLKKELGPSSEEDGLFYQIQEAQNLKNSIFAQYGFEFKNPDVKQEMTARACLKDIKYNYSAMPEIDRQNIHALSDLVSEYKETQGKQFDKLWKRYAKQKNQKELLNLVNGNYCVFSTDGINPKAVFYFSEDGTVKIASNLKGVDTTSLDRTSIVDVNLSTKGTWSIVKSELFISADTLKMKNVKISITERFNYQDTDVLDCTSKK